MRSTFVIRVEATIASAFPLAACGGDPPAPALAGRSSNPASHVTATLAATIVYVGREYLFSGPSTVASGSVQVTLRNAGREFHNLTVARVPDGVVVPTDVNRLSELLFGTTIGERSAPTVIGGIHAADPGATATAVIDLTPGQYVVACDIADNQANFHYQRGMIMTLVAT